MEKTERRLSESSAVARRINASAEEFKIPLSQVCKEIGLPKSQLTQILKKFGYRA